MAKEFFGVKTQAPKISTRPELMRSLVRRGLDNTAAQAKRDMQKVTRTWEMQPIFAVVTSTKRNGLSISVQTNDKIFRLVSLGAPPHKIRARLAPMLMFKNKYKAKTKPNVLSSSDGGKSGDTIRTLEVDHPGHAARNFHILIAKRLQTKLQQEMNRALRDYLRVTVLPEKGKP